MSSSTQSGVLDAVSYQVKALRRSRGLSQQALADASGVSRRMIAAIESRQDNLSLVTVDKLAQALSVRFADMFTPKELEPRSISRVNAWYGDDPESWARIAETSSDARVELWEWSLAPGEEYHAEPDPAGMEELIFCLSGRLVVKVQGEELHLEVGQTTHFQSDTLYSYRCTGLEKAKFLKCVIKR